MALVDRYTCGDCEQLALKQVDLRLVPRPAASSTLLKPTPLHVRAAGIPKTMRAERRWVVWAYEWIEPTDGKLGRWTNVPFIAITSPVKASSTKPETWRSVSEALKAYDDG